MSVKFITSRIHTGTTVSLQDAAKKAQQGQVKSIDEILADLKQVKTVSTEQPMTKVASTEQPVVVAKKEKKEEEEEVEVVEVEGKKPAKYKDCKHKPCKCASKKSTLKVAKKLDFRGWSAEGIVKAWASHEDVKGCIANVQNKVNAPEVYCGLLQVASEEASKMIKAAKVKEQKQVVASNGFEKLAKMSKDQIQLLREYFTPLYGEKYVDSLLGDY
jgi:hypothetical protein